MAQGLAFLFFFFFLDSATAAIGKKGGNHCIPTSRPGGVASALTADVNCFHSICKLTTLSQIHGRP